MPSVTATDGPVAVTGASGYIGAHTVIALLKRGYDVHACVTDLSNPDKTEFLLALNDEHPGSVTLHEANLLEEGSYDAPFADCSAVLHVGTPMGYGGGEQPAAGLRRRHQRCPQHRRLREELRFGQASGLHQFLRRHRAPVAVRLPLHRGGLGIRQPGERQELEHREPGFRRARLAIPWPRWNASAS